MWLSIYGWRTLLQTQTTTTYAASYTKTNRWNMSTVALARKRTPLRLCSQTLISGTRCGQCPVTRISNVCISDVCIKSRSRGSLRCGCDEAPVIIQVMWAVWSITRSCDDARASVLWDARAVNAVSRCSLKTHFNMRSSHFLSHERNNLIRQIEKGYSGFSAFVPK